MEGCRPLPNTQHSSVGATETLSLCGLGASVAYSGLSQSCPTLAPQPVHQVVPPNSLMYYLHSLESAEKPVSLFGKSDDLLTSSGDSDFTLQVLLTPSSTDNPSQPAPDLRKLIFTLPKPSPTVDVPRLLLCVSSGGQARVT